MPLDAHRNFGARMLFHLRRMYARRRELLSQPRSRRPQNLKTTKTEHTTQPEKSRENNNKKYQVIYSGGELTTSKIENYETNKI